MWKYLVAWCGMLLISVANGAVRDLTYGRYMTEPRANQLSCVCSILLLGIFIWAFMRRYPPLTGHEAVSIGVFWMLLTVAFEFFFFHYVGRHSWSELLANYNVVKGRLWVVVLAWIASAPYAFFRFDRAA